MMEFTLSRVTLIICGAILIAAVAVPLSGIYEDKTQDSLGDMTEKTAVMIDSFGNSDIDRMYLDGDALLPSAEYSLSVEGYEVTMTDGSGNEYRSYLKNKAGSFAVSKGEIVTLVKYNGVLTAEENVPQTVEETNVPDATEEVEEEEPEEDEEYVEPTTVKKTSSGGIRVSCRPIVLLL